MLGISDSVSYTVLEMLLIVFLIGILGVSVLKFYKAQLLEDTKKLILYTTPDSTVILGCESDSGNVFMQQAEMDSVLLSLDGERVSVDLKIVK